MPKKTTNVGGVEVPDEMIAKPEPETVAIAVPDEKMIAEIKELSNTKNTDTIEFPMLKLQHVTTIDGEPNELRGHFTKVTKNDMGDWITEDLGETIKMQFLMQRFFLKMMKGEDLYTSSEFESDMDKIALWKRRGEESEMVGEDTPHNLQGKFLKKDDQNRVRSELNKLSKLYVMLNGEVMIWKLSLTGTIAWSKYTKLINFPAGVITAVGRTEEKKGTIKYYVPAFKALERITDLTAIKDNIQILRDLLPRSGQPNPIIIEDEGLPFK